MAHKTSSNMSFSTIIKAVFCTAIIGFTLLVPANGAAIRGADDSRVPTRAPSIKPSITITDHTEKNDFDIVESTNDDQRINNNENAPLLTQESANLVDELAQQRERKLLTRKRTNKNTNPNGNKQKNKNVKATKPKQPNDGSPTPSPTSAYEEVLDLSIPPELNECLLRALPARARKKKFVKGGNTQKGKLTKGNGNGNGQGKKGQGKNKNNRSLQGQDSEGFDYTGANELRSFILKYNGMDDDDSDSDDENYFVDDDDNTKSKPAYNNLLFDEDDDDMDVDTYEEIQRRLQSVTSDYNRAAINACLTPHQPDKERICQATPSPTLSPTEKTTQPPPTCPDRNPPQCPNNVVCLPGQDTLDPITGCPCECDCPYNPVPECPPTTVCTPDELFYGTGDGCPCVCAPPSAKGKGKGKGHYVGKGKGYHVGKGKGKGGGYGKGGKGSKGGYYYYNYAALAKENSYDSRVVRIVRKGICLQSAVPSQVPSESPTAEPTRAPTPRPTPNPTPQPTEPAITSRPSPRPTRRTPNPTVQGTRPPTCPVPYPDCPDRVTCDPNSIVTDPDTDCPCFCKKEPGKGKGKGKGHYAKGGGAKGQYAKGVGKGVGKGYGGKYQKKTKKGNLDPGRTKQPKASKNGSMAALEGDGSEYPSFSPLPSSEAESGEAELAELASSETAARQRKRKKKSLQGEESVDSEDGSTITLRYLLQYLEEEDEKQESRGTKLRGRASSLSDGK